MTHKRDTVATIIEYDYSAAVTWRERVVTIGACTGAPPDCIGPYPWRHELGCWDTYDDNPGVRIYCTCGVEGPIFASEAEAIAAWNAERGVDTAVVTDWIVHPCLPAGDPGQPF